MTRTTAPFGTWTSPLTALDVAGNSRRLGCLHLGPEAVYWTEGRAEEAGRCVIVKYDKEGVKTDMTGLEFSARSRVHEYGGGEFSVWNDRIFFVNDADQDIYELTGNQPPQRVCEKADWRFSDLCYDPRRNQLFAVAERHDTGSRLPVNLLVSIDVVEPSRGEIYVVAEGRDFYASPRISPCGLRLAYLCWDLPHMPWEAAELWMAEGDSQNRFPSGEKLAGGLGEYVFQPEWRSDGSLIFIWDQDGWGKLYLWPCDDGNAAPQALVDEDAEFGHPQWLFGMRSYGLVDGGRLIARYFKAGVLHLAIVDMNKRMLRQIDVVALDIAGIEAIIADEAAAYMIACFHHRAPAVCRLDLSSGELDIIQTSSETQVSCGTISVGEPLAFSSIGGRECFGLYYAPANAAYQSPENELPPVIVSAHGGPTGMADRGLKLKIQYWTSRGFGFFDVDYTGSFGYGSTYRRALDGFWGLRDVEDVIAGAKALALQGRADAKRVLISGSSAGGYTVLAALVHSDVFAAGAAYYGISDMHKLQEATHKFELGYIDTLMGTEPETRAEIFTARSPICHAGKITAPVIFFQGAEDRVVPSEQSQAMAETLKGNGVPVVYVEFAGEGHGFRQAKNIAAALKYEYAFYARILGLTTGHELPELKISNFGDA